MTLEKTYYELLEIEPDADADAIRSAYRRLANKFHPDHPEGDAEIFRILTDAWRVVSDPRRRAEYDRGLEDDKGKS